MSQSLEITAEQLSEELSNETPLLLFDLRLKEDFEKSHIDGAVHAVCDAQAKEKLMPKIPKSTKIVLISEPEDFSRETATMMQSLGMDSHYLAGGFSSWQGKVTQGQTGKIRQYRE